MDNLGLAIIAVILLLLVLYSWRHSRTSSMTAMGLGMEPGPGGWPDYGAPIVGSPYYQFSHGAGALPPWKEDVRSLVYAAARLDQPSHAATTYGPRDVKLSA